MSDLPFWTGKTDKNGRRINLGDIVLHHNESKNTKPEYWNPIYKVVWFAPCFQMEHVGGGKSGSDMTFTMRYYPETLEVIKAADLAPTPEQIAADTRVQKLVEKARALINRWDSPLWKDLPHTHVCIGELRAALEEFTTTTTTKETQ